MKNFILSNIYTIIFSIGLISGVFIADIFNGFIYDDLTKDLSDRYKEIDSSKEQLLAWENELVVKENKLYKLKYYYDTIYGLPVSENPVLDLKKYQAFERGLKKSKKDNKGITFPYE